MDPGNLVLARGTGRLAGQVALQSNVEVGHMKSIVGHFVFL